jgi:hypothetical protein
VRAQRSHAPESARRVCIYAEIDMANRKTPSIGVLFAWLLVDEFLRRGPNDMSFLTVLAALGAVLLTDASAVAPVFSGIFMEKMVGLRGIDC